MTALFCCLLFNPTRLSIRWACGQDTRQWGQAVVNATALSTGCPHGPKEARGSAGLVHKSIGLTGDHHSVPSVRCVRVGLLHGVQFHLALMSPLGVGGRPSHYFRIAKRGHYRIALTIPESRLYNETGFISICGCISEINVLDCSDNT